MRTSTSSRITLVTSLDHVNIQATEDFGRLTHRFRQRRTPLDFVAGIHQRILEFAGLVVVLQNSQAAKNRQTGVLKNRQLTWVELFLTQKSVELRSHDVPAVLLREHPKAAVIVDKEAKTFPKRTITYVDRVSGETLETEVYLSAEPDKDSVIVLSLHGFATRAWK